VNLCRDPVTMSRSVDDTNTSLGPAWAANPGADVHGQAGDVVFQGAAAHLHLTRVDSDPHLDPQHPDRVDDGIRARDRRARAAERGDESVSGRVDFAAGESLQFVTHDGVVVVQEIAPAVVAEQGGALGRTDDVGEDDRRQQALGIRPAAHAGDELLDLVDHRSGVAHPIQRIFAR